MSFSHKGVKEKVLVSPPPHSISKEDKHPLGFEVSIQGVLKTLLLKLLKQMYSFYFLYECFACMYVSVPHMCLVPLKVRPPGTGVTDGC